MTKFGIAPAGHSWLKKVSRDKVDIAPLSQSGIYRAVTKEKCLEVLLSLDVNGVAFFETIEDANVARQIALYMNQSTHFDTQDQHLYFRTSHQRGKEHNCVLAIQRMSEDSPHLSQLGFAKRRHYNEIEWRRKEEERNKLIREKEQKAEEERRKAREKEQKEFEEWWSTASPTQKLDYELKKKKLDSIRKKDEAHKEERQLIKRFIKENGYPPGLTDFIRSNSRKTASTGSTVYGSHSNTGVVTFTNKDFTKTKKARRRRK